MGLVWNWELEPTWRHGPLLGTVNAAATTFAASTVADTAGLDPWVLAAGGGAGMLGALIAAGRAGLSGASMVYRSACWACAGGWATWAAANTPWSVDGVGALAAGAVGLGLAAPLLSRHERAGRERAARMLAITAKGQAANEWTSRLARVCQIRGAQVVGIEPWAWQVDGKPTGYTVDLDLPGGAHWKRLRQHAEELAADARLPEGCGVEARPGANRGACLLHVATIDALRKEIPYPSDYGELTCLNPIQFGVHRDGSPADVEVRRACAMVIGQTDSGKTNTMQAVNAGLVRCVDTVVWHIDLNGGGLALPWIRPWWESRHEAEPERLANPAIDWVAADGNEALLMARAGLEIARKRKAAYATSMRAANDDKIPISPAVPLIYIVVDEIANIMGEDTEHPRVRDALRAIQNEGRAAGVRIAYGGLRATGEITGGANVLKQARYRIGMWVQDIEELQYLFGRSQGLSLEELMAAGYGYLARGNEVPSLFRSWRLLPAQIEDIARTVAGRRPALDAVSARLAGPAYATRWERAGWIDAAGDGTAVPVSAHAAASTPAPAAGDDDPAPALGEALSDLDASRRRLADAVARDGLPDAEVDAQFAGLVAGWDTDAAEPTPRDDAGTGGGDSAATAAARTRMLELLHAAGPAGMTVTALWKALVAEGIERTRQAVSDWLRIAAAAGQVVQPADRGPYIHADHAPRGGDGQ
jgi:hypothetical protein